MIRFTAAVSAAALASDSLGSFIPVPSRSIRWLFRSCNYNLSHASAHFRKIAKLRIAHFHASRSRDSIHCMIQNRLIIMNPSFRNVILTIRETRKVARRSPPVIIRHPPDRPSAGSRSAARPCAWLRSCCPRRRE